MSNPATATIRMFRMGELGDCFLLEFASGNTSSRMLIDCGSFRNGAPSIARVTRVVEGIRAELNGAPLDVVAATHQHNDHVSGFVHCETQFRAMNVGQVLFSWLDNPDDPDAREIGEKHGNLLAHLTAASRALRLRRGARPKQLEMIDDLLGFHGASAGAPPEVPRKAIEALRTMGSQPPQYVRPGQSLEMPGLPPGSVRLHVLGPPENKGLLYRKDPRKGESYDHALAAAGQQAARFLAAVQQGVGAIDREEEHYPFSKVLKRTGKEKGTALAAIRRQYGAKEESWRTIGDDWLDQGGALALFLDTFTNNSSLVLAIELVASRKVLLFAGDAQTGNWLSWEDVQWADPSITTSSLLSNTVLYKAGHHASHNATLPALFEKMRRPDLMALIPVDKSDPNITKENGWKMPAPGLFEKLKEQTRNRVLQMDNDNPPECDPAREPARSAWAEAGVKPEVSDLAVKLVIEG